MIPAIIAATLTPPLQTGEESADRAADGDRRDDAVTPRQDAVSSTAARVLNLVIKGPLVDRPRGFRARATSTVSMSCAIRTILRAAAWKWTPRMAAASAWLATRVAISCARPIPHQNRQARSL